MPLYLDVHRNLSASKDDVAKAHISDLEAQDEYGVRYIKYWVNQKDHCVCCLVEGPDPESCVAVHRKAHGLEPDEIIEVESRMIEAFLGGNPVDDVGAVMMSSGALDSAHRVILFTDIVDSTALTQRLGDEGAMEVLRCHDAIVRTALAATRGREVKHTGDGIMGAFVSAPDAVRCALAIQESIERHNREEPDRVFGLRIGLSAGEPVCQNKDLFGAAVQMAARVCDCAGPNQVVVANIVRELCVGKSFGFSDMGKAELKGFAEPVRIFAVTPSGVTAGSNTSSD